MDYKDSEKNRVFTRRAIIIGAMQAGFLGVLGGRLAWLQVAQGQKYKTLSDKNRINVKLLSPSRGYIVDRNGKPLAINGQNFRLLMIPEQTNGIEAALYKLQKIISLSEKEIKTVLEVAEKKAQFVPLEIRDNLSWKDVAKVEVNLPYLPGVSIDEGEIRSYPHGEATAHFIGYVGAVSKADLEKEDNPLLSLPGFKIGRTGIEKSFDNHLRGVSGNAQVEVNVMGREVRQLEQNASRAGDKVQLTIDIDLQSKVMEILSRERSSSAVVMNVNTGEVYCLASYPSFDANLFTKGLPQDRWEELRTNPAFPLINKAISGQYPPGSTFKMITALAALEEGVINKYDTVYCPGHYEMGRDRFHCWKRGGHGTANLDRALAESCDVYFYDVATKLGIDTIARYANMFGLGDRLGFELSEESPGLMPTEKWKMGHFGNKWQPGETIVASIGQGYIQSTPLQLAVMTSRLVNGGRAVKPWISAAVGDRKRAETNWPHVDVSQSNLNLVLKGMNRTVTHPKGTAHSSRLSDPSQQMGGKTGTAQVRRITRQERLEGVRNEDKAWKLRHHALFVGYAPITDPVYACAVVVEHGVSGGRAAAPIARDILKVVQDIDPARNSLLERSANSYDVKSGPPKKPVLSREGI